MKKLFSLGILSLVLMIGCKSKEVSPVEENDNQTVIEEESELKEDTPIVIEEEKDEFDLNAFVAEIQSLGQQVAAEEDASIAVYDHLDAFKQFGETSDEALIDQFVADLVLYDNYSSLEMLYSLVTDLGELDNYYKSNEIHEVWLIFGNLYDIESNIEYEYTGPVYEQEPQQDYTNEQPTQQQDTPKVMIYKVSATLETFDALKYYLAYGSAEDQGYDYVIYDFDNGAAVMFGDSIAFFKGDDNYMAFLVGANNGMYTSIANQLSDLN